MDAQLNPRTGGYTGAQTGTLENAVYLRLETPKGTWWADRSLGSLLYTLSREKDLPRVRNLAAQYGEQALKPLKDDGRARQIDVTSKSGNKGWLILLIEIVEHTGKTHHFEHQVKVS